VSGAEDRAASPRATRRRSHRGLVLAAIVIVMAGFGVGLVEALHLPRGSIWGVVALAAVVVGAIRALTSR
jgi:hypothetical protein